MVHLGNDWDEILAGEFEQDYYKRIRYWLKKEYAEQTIYPAAENIFNALRYTPYSKVKAVILGQDPYHGPGQAHGLCFSVQPGVQPPPSLQNIFKELQSDLGIVPPKDGTLTKWAERGRLPHPRRGQKGFFLPQGCCAPMYPHIRSSQTAYCYTYQKVNAEGGTACRPKGKLTVARGTRCLTQKRPSSACKSTPTAVPLFEAVPPIRFSPDYQLRETGVPRGRALI